MIGRGSKAREEVPKACGGNSDEEELGVLRL